MYNAGDFDTTETVILPVNTFSSDDPAASVTVTNLAAGDVEIHKDGSTTQRSSDSGVSVTIDFDSITGNHIVSIDLSDNTDAGFYANGSRYLVRIEGATVDGGTINAWIGGFSIGCTLRPATAGRTVVVDADGLIDANTVKSGPSGSGTAQTANDNGADINAILTDTNELQTDWTNGGRLDLIIDELTTQGDTNEGKIDTIDTNVDAALADTNEIQGMLPSKSYLTGTNNADGDVQGDEMTGEVPATITSTAISDIASQVSTEGYGALLTQKLAAFID